MRHVCFLFIGCCFCVYSFAMDVDGDDQHQVRIGLPSNSTIYIPEDPESLTLNDVIMLIDLEDFSRDGEGKYLEVLLKRWKDYRGITSKDNLIGYCENLALYYEHKKFLELKKQTAELATQINSY